MKHLLLLRHARAALGGADHERPLSAEGRRDAERLGALIARGDLRPTLALCSTARRARETLEAVEAQLHPRPSVVVEPDLYVADARSLLERVAGVDGVVEVVLLVGHNPAISELARLLAGQGQGDELSRLRRGLGAGALAALQLERGSWADMAPAGSRLLALLEPAKPR